MIEYKKLSKETQLFLNKAMDIYATIKDKTIKRSIKDIINKHQEYEFTKLDKKILALFIAGLLVDGNLKEIFSQYDDIKLDDLFDFIGIKESDIIPIENEKYEEFFNKNLKLDLMNIFMEDIYNKKINFITPEIIVKSLQFSHICHSMILDYFSRIYKLSFSGVLGISEHPIFDALANYIITDGSTAKEKSLKNNKDKLNSSLFNMSTLNSDMTKPAPKQRKKSKPIEIGDNLWHMLDEIQKKFIGQEVAAEELFYNIVNNQQLAVMDNIPDGQRSIIFLDGPTGTGKTAITREITDKLGIPFVSTSVTNYSATGYVGGNITDVLKDLLKKSGDDLELAQRGIVVFDEFDKIAYSRNGGLEMKRAVQQQLLDFLGGGKYNIRTGESVFNVGGIEFDTSKLTFICLGALTNLRAHKTQKKSVIGFGQNNDTTEEYEYSITPQDLMSVGLERELVGRFNTYLHTNDYSIDSLEKILRVSTISPILGFKKWVESRGKELIIDDDVYRLIAEQAYELNTGARSLQTIMNNIRTQFLKKVLRDPEKTIHLDSETVIKTNNQTMKRNGRR